MFDPCYLRVKVHLSQPAVMNELERHFVSTWVLRDDFTADAQRVPALPPGHANVAKNMLEAFVFPVTCVVWSKFNCREEIVTSSKFSVKMEYCFVIILHSCIHIFLCRIHRWLAQMAASFKVLS